MAQARRRCRFCSQPGSSREHIIARWIGRSLKPDPLPGTVIRFRHAFANPEAGVELREKSAANPAYYTRAFCRDCNTGWMADLEGAIKPIFTRLFEEQAAPRNCQIWLAAVRSGDSLNYRAHTVMRRGQTEDGADGFGASLILGRVASTSSWVSRSPSAFGWVPQFRWPCEKFILCRRETSCGPPCARAAAYRACAG